MSYVKKRRYEVRQITGRAREKRERERTYDVLEICDNIKSLRWRHAWSIDIYIYIYYVF